METQLIEIHKEQLLIHTGMSSRTFAQSHISESLHENGWIAKQTKFDNWDFTPYQFSDINAKQKGTHSHEEIVVIGPSFEGVTLASLFENIETEITDTIAFNRLIEILEKLTSAIEASFLREDVHIVANGPLNIIVSNENSFLFLPDTLFKRSLNELSVSDYSKNYGCFLNQSLNNVKSEWRFSLACMIYFVFSGSLPYAELNNEKRVEDYYDQRFIPLEKIIQIPAKDENVLQILKTNLSQQAYLRNKGKSKRQNNTTIKNTKTESKPFLNNSIHHLANTYRKLNLNKEQKIRIQFDIEKFAKKQNKTIKRKRFFRHHRIAIFVSIITIFILASITNSIIKGNLSKTTTQGMSAFQVVEAFYDGINTINIDKVESTGTTKALKNITDSLSAIFVTQQMRVAYEHIAPYYTPQQWLNSPNPSDNVIYGLTHLKITSLIKPTTQKQTQNLNTNTFNYVAEIGDKATFIATYYLINSNANHEYAVIYQKDTIYLEYLKNNYWQILKIEREADNKLTIDNNQLTSNLTAALEQSTQKNRGTQIAEILIEKYPWIPYPKNVEKAANVIEQ